MTQFGPREGPGALLAAVVRGDRDAGNTRIDLTETLLSDLEDRGRTDAKDPPVRSAPRTPSRKR